MAMAHFVILHDSMTQHFNDTTVLGVKHTKAEAVEFALAKWQEVARSYGIEPTYNPADEQYGEFLPDPNRGSWLASHEFLNGTERFSLVRTGDGDCLVDEVYVRETIEIAEVD